MSQGRFADCAAALKFHNESDLASLSREELSELVGRTKGPLVFRAVRAKLRDGTFPTFYLKEREREERRGREFLIVVVIILVHT